VHSQTRRENFPACGRQAKACNAGLVDIEWVIEDLTKSEVQQSWHVVVPHVQKVPLQAFSSVPGGSVLGSFLQY
jgi:hypothetical protein